MINVIRDDGAVIKRLLGYQFAAALLGVLLSTSSAQVKILNFATSILAAVFYCYFIYSAVWEAAAKDRLKVDGGRMTKDMTRGLKFAFCANIPNMILGVLAVVFTFLGVVTQMEWAGNIAIIPTVLARFWEGMYNGIIVFLVPTGLGPIGTVLSTFIYLAIIVPAFAVSHFAYYMGYNGKRIIKIEQKKN